MSLSSVESDTCFLLTASILLLLTSFFLFTFKAFILVKTGVEYANLPATSQFFHVSNSKLKESELRHPQSARMVISIFYERKNKGP